ncbi:hypothetical protein [Bacillus sp. FSL K6-0268]|uniref:hypothetical protein n=1 Tax=Bacillus sp. FSL K6-0268 TaxID=2921449 RepID=UPI0030FAE806
MKFVFEGGKMVAANSGYIGEKAKEGSFMDIINDFSDSIVETEIEFILKPIGHFFKESGLLIWDWFVMNLPDIMGYGALLTAACIIIGAMIRKGGMMKPLAYFAGALIIAVCILGGV